MQQSTSKGENWFQEAQSFLNGMGAAFMSTMPHLIIWLDGFVDKMINSFFLVTVALDMIKILWQSLSLAWAHNINLGKSAELGFTFLKTGVVCLMLFGASVLTFAASFALMGLMLGLDPVVNFLKTAYFAIRMFCEDDMGKKEFFYEQTVESATHCIISGIIGSAFVAIIFLPEVIGAAAITAISVIGGGLLSILGVGLMIKGISKAAHQINKWLWPEKKEKVTIGAHNLNTKNIEHDIQILPQDQTQKIEEKKSTLDYYQYAAVPKNTMDIKDIQNDISNHYTVLKNKIENKNPSVFDHWQNKKREDKIHALEILNSVSSQWETIMNSGGSLKLSTHDNYLFHISKIKKAHEFSENKEGFEKQTNRILKLTKNHILEKYPSAFQSWKYKGKVESLYEQTFFALKEKAKNLPQPPAAAMDDQTATFIS